MRERKGKSILLKNHMMPCFVAHAHAVRKVNTIRTNRIRMIITQNNKQNFHATIVKNLVTTSKIVQRKRKTKKIKKTRTRMQIFVVEDVLIRRKVMMISFPCSLCMLT